MIKHFVKRKGNSFGQEGKTEYLKKKKRKKLILQSRQHYHFFWIYCHFSFPMNKKHRGAGAVDLNVRPTSGGLGARIQAATDLSR